MLTLGTTAPAYLPAALEVGSMPQNRQPNAGEAIRREHEPESPGRRATRAKGGFAPLPDREDALESGIKISVERRERQRRPGRRGGRAHAGKHGLCDAAATLSCDPRPQTKEQQDRDARRAADGGREALTLEYLPLVRSIARRMHARMPRHVELEELVSAGTLGLLDAIERYSAAKGAQFGTFAQHRVRGAILDHLRASDEGTRELRRRGRAFEAVHAELTARYHRAPSEEEMAVALALPLEQVQGWRRDFDALRRVQENGENERSLSQGVLDRLAAPEEEQPLSLLLQHEEQYRVRAAVGALPERQRRVLTLYYYEEINMREIGRRLGVVESRVSQLRTLALTNLRQQLTACA